MLFIIVHLLKFFIRAAKPTASACAGSGTIISCSLVSTIVMDYMYNVLKFPLLFRLRQLML